MATNMERLQQFTYVSTAYSHCTRATIAEKFYPIPINPNFLIKLMEKWIMDDNNSDILDVITAKLIYPWPNNYTFSKAASEELVRQYGDKYSTLIIRPSISKIYILFFVLYFFLLLFCGFNFNGIFLNFITINLQLFQRIKIRLLAGQTI